VNYKRVSAVAQVPHIYFLKARTLFLIGEAHKGVRLLMRQSLCTSKHQYNFVPPKKFMSNQGQNS
jgi:hypothetical protein